LAYKTALLIRLRIRNTIPSWGNRSQNAQIQSNAAAAQEKPRGRAINCRSALR
jgi:hypothetical protein